MSENPQYTNLQTQTANIPIGIEIDRLTKYAKILRALIFTTVEAGQSGHPGGSSSKVEQMLGLIFSGVLKFDFLSPKNSGRDRIVWSAGHCTPLLHSIQAFIYEALRRLGHQFDKTILNAVLPEDLVRFRHSDGPQGHAESNYPLSDYSTGPSGHGLSAAGGLAASHRAVGLDTKVFVLMGDAESAEGITYEIRNLASTLGLQNLIVSFDYNHFGLDGPIEEVVRSPILNHWLGLGWNVIEINGHDILQCIKAYQLAFAGFENNLPTVVLAHTIKGKDYGQVANTSASHGLPAKHEEYVQIVQKLGFNILGKPDDVMTDIETIIDTITPQDCAYIEQIVRQNAIRITPERDLIKQIKKTLQGRNIIDPRVIKRPLEMPKELIFAAGEKLATRKAASYWFKWLMNQTAFFYAGAGDISGSVLFKETEDVYGLINQNNPIGRGIRFGIAEQNMAMFSSALTQDILPGGFRPVSVFGTFAVFTSMMSNCVRLALINNHLCPERAGFFIMLASHDGPETGEDGPTHQGLYWMSNFMAYPGIKVYKPFDANETIEMLFYALTKGEPIALSVSRPNSLVLKRGDGVPPAIEAINGSYVYKSFSNIGNQKKILVISGSQILLNVLEILPKLEKHGIDVKIINVTSPELFEELRKNNPQKALEILSDEERPLVITLHNGWKGWLDSFMLPADHENRRIGVDTYLKSGNIEEIYEVAELTSDNIFAKILKNVHIHS